MEATYSTSVDHSAPRTTNRKPKGFEQDAPAGWLFIIPIAMGAIVVLAAWIGATAH